MSATVVLALTLKALALKSPTVPAPIRNERIAAKTVNETQYCPRAWDKDFNVKREGPATEAEIIANLCSDGDTKPAADNPNIPNQSASKIPQSYVAYAKALSDQSLASSTIFVATK